MNVRMTPGAAVRIVAAVVALLAGVRCSGIRVARNVAVTMRDGVRLSADVYFPKSPGRHPVLLARTPYGKSGPAEQKTARRFVSRGYVVVIEDVRGRGESDGVFTPFQHEAEDGYDTEQWCAVQEWSNGDVGAYGGSYVAGAAWLSAALGNPHLKAMALTQSASDYYDDWAYRGGAFQLLPLLIWSTSFGAESGTNPTPDAWMRAFHHLPLETQPEVLGRDGRIFSEWLRHPTRDEFWARWSNRGKYGRIAVPVLHIGGWYDVFAQGTAENFAGMFHEAPAAVRGKQRLVIGPWSHDMGIRRKVGDVDFGPEAAVDTDRLVLDWFDRWLRRGPAPQQDPPARLFMMGRNEWRDESDWPPQGLVYERLYLQGTAPSGGASREGRLSRFPPAEERPDQFLYDPADPVPVRGGNLCCLAPIFIAGPQDQRRVETRMDVLVYTGAPLAEALEITGPVALVLYAATSAPETDFTAKLVDVDPSGYARNIADGVLRTGYRDGAGNAPASAPGRPNPFRIDLGVTSHAFLPGHRIRVDVSSSNFPRFSRNLNTGRSGASETSWSVARQTVFHGANTPSHLLLPVVDRRR